MRVHMKDLGHFLGLEQPVPDPVLEIRGGGGGGEPVKKKIFFGRSGLSLV